MSTRAESYSSVGAEPDEERLMNVNMAELQFRYPDFAQSRRGIVGKDGGFHIENSIVGDSGNFLRLTATMFLVQSHLELSDTGLRKGSTTRPYFGT